MASNNQKCVWVYAVGYELVHYFQTAEEADGWWAGYKVLAGDDVEGAIEQVWMFPSPPSPLSTALALASSKTNWTAIVPARAPPPPPPSPVSWKDGMCWTCCVKPGTNSTFRDALGENELTCDKCHRREYPQDYDCSICGLSGGACEDGESSSVGTITVCGRDIEVCEDCDKGGDNYDGFLDRYEFCAETSSYEYDVRVDEDAFLRSAPCPICSGPRECDCDKCGLWLCYDCVRGGQGPDEDLNLCPECVEQDIVGCCEKCELEIERDCDEHDNCHIIDGGDAADKFRCQRCLVDCPCAECDDGPEHDICCKCGKFEDTGNVCDCGGSHRELCDECKEEKYPICQVCGIDECVDYDDSLCHGCYHKDVGASDCWCAGEGSATTDRARDALKRWAEKEEVKKYKAVLAETLRFEAIMDMMKSGDA